MGAPSLSSGDRLGRYQIAALIGEGGMGQVYRARDPELKRDVAIKVLNRTGASPEDLARFTREARAAGSLNHPDIVIVYDVGIEAGAPYVVTELLDGETLRARIDRAPIPFLKAVEYAAHLADALGAAHAKGIWHRDVKPANVFLTADGRVKLLDFGIAKLAERHIKADANDPTLDVSDRHAVLGTAGYMAPEQVLGQPADHRSDIFALGAVLYEMFTRTRAFKGRSSVETMTAVLHEDPADLLTIKPDLPPTAVAIVRRCLEKNKEERFQSARDLAFDLQQLRESSVSTRPVSGTVRHRRWPWLRLAGLAAVVAAGIAVGWIFKPAASVPTFEPLTFARARIGNARFVSDGRAVVYSEARSGSQLQVWRLEIGESPPTRPLEYAIGTDVLATSASELSLLVNRHFLTGERFVGTLARAPLGGGSPRELDRNVEDADWDSDGRNLVLVRSDGGLGGNSWIEYPASNRLYQTAGSIRSPRMSRDGRHLAFLEDGAAAAEGGRVMLLNVKTGETRPLTESWRSARGLAWSHDGREIWFTAGKAFASRTLQGVTVAGTQRTVLAVPGPLTLWDIAPDGRVLLSRDDERRALVGVPPGAQSERDVSWLDDSGLADLSDDGRLLLFADRTGFHVAATDGSSFVALQHPDAYADSLSSDGTKVLATSRSTSAVLMILPTGAGSPETLPAHSITHYRGASWFPDGQQILFTGKVKDGLVRSYVQDVRGGAPKALTPEGVWGLAISPEGTSVAAITGDGTAGISIWPVAGGAPRMVPGSQPGDRPVGWHADGRSLWIFRRGEIPAPVIQLDIESGRRQLWKMLAAADPVGIYSITEFAITADGGSYFYSYRRGLSQLYLVNGLE
jgi:Tol biopolymer transport system component